MKAHSRHVYTEAERQAARARVRQGGAVALASLAPLMQIGMAQGMYQSVASLDEMRTLVADFPFMVELDFQCLVEERDQTPERVQRLAWLRQIAEET